MNRSRTRGVRPPPSDADATSPDLPDLAADSYAAAMPVFRYLARVTAGA